MEFVSGEKNKKKDVYLGEGTTPNEFSDFEKRCFEHTESIIKQIEKALDSYGFEIELITDYEDYDDDYVGMFLASEQTNSSVFPIVINPKVIYNYLKETDDVDNHNYLVWAIKSTLWHEVGHGIVSYLSDVYDFDWDEEEVVEEFARIVCDTNKLDGELIDALNEFESEYDSNNINEELLSESLHKLGSNCFITDSPYNIKNLLMNKPKLYRILYDSNIDMYMIGDGNEIIHWDMIREAYKQGYYANQEKFMEELGGTLDNYVETGTYGIYDDDYEVDPYLLYMVFSPDNEEFMLGEDGYDGQLKFNFGYLFLRDADQGVMDNCDLIRILQKQSWASVNEDLSREDAVAVGKFGRECREDRLDLMDYDEFADLLRQRMMTPNQELYKIYVDAYEGRPDDYDDQMKIVDKIINEFKKMSTEQIVKLVNIPHRDQVVTDSPMFILPNGTLVSVKEVGKNLGYDLSWIHGDLIHMALNTLANNLGLYYPTEMEDSENDLLEHLTYELGWVRINCGTTWTEDRFYCVLPATMTNPQFRSLEKWLEWGYDNHKGDDEVLIFFEHTTRVYEFKEHFPEDIIKKIKRYYSSGRLYENRNELKENMDITNEVQRAVNNIMKNKSKYRNQDDLEDAIYSAVANCFSGLHGVTRDTADMIVDVYEQELKRVGLSESYVTNDDGIVTQERGDRFTVTAWKGNKILYSGDSFEDAVRVYKKSEDSGEYCSFNDKAGRYQQDRVNKMVDQLSMNESNELEQRAKKHKKKSKGMGWHMSVNAGDVDTAIDVFNNATSLGTGCGDSCSMGEAMENKTYCYNGPIYYDGREIASHSNICTTAPSYNVALRNILYKAAKGDKELYHYNIEDELVKEVPNSNRASHSSDNKEKCYRCGYTLNDMGDCPVCDYGEEDLLESLSDLEALWKLSSLD